MPMYHTKSRTKLEDIKLLFFRWIIRHLSACSNVQFCALFHFCTLFFLVLISRKFTYWSKMAFLAFRMTEVFIGCFFDIMLV